MILLLIGSIHGLRAFRTCIILVCLLCIFLRGMFVGVSGGVGLRVRTVFILVFFGFGLGWIVSIHILLTYPRMIS